MTQIERSKKEWPLQRKPSVAIRRHPLPLRISLLHLDELRLVLEELPSLLRVDVADRLPLLEQRNTLPSQKLEHSKREWMKRRRGSTPCTALGL